MSGLTSPASLDAHEPPEAVNGARDDVRLLVASREEGDLVHARFRDLPRFLAAGDLLVVNASATLPAAVPGSLGGDEVELRLSTALAGDVWVIELRTRDRRPYGPPPIGRRVGLPAQAHAGLLQPHGDGGRLAVARLELGGRPVEDYLREHGRPIRYDYVDREWPIEAYQTVFGRSPGSAEMPSAARPFTHELVSSLAARGVLFAPLILHTGVSSLERGEAPYPERYVVPETTARVVNAVHAWGGRVIAVGTTVVRALETVAAPSGSVQPGAGTTDLVITPARGLRACDGLLTGWHDADASHQDLLRAAAGTELLRRSYEAAADHGYRKHEFGDSHLILPWLREEIDFIPSV